MTGKRVQFLARFASVWVIALPLLSHADSPFVAKAPCRKEASENSCTPSFLKCEDTEYRNTIINDLNDRFKEMETTEVEKFKEATYGTKEGMFIRSCGVAQINGPGYWKNKKPQKAKDCEKNFPGYVYSFNPGTLQFETAFKFEGDAPGKGQGVHVDALYGDLKHKAVECNTQSVIEEVLNTNSLKVESPACIPLAKDIEKMTQAYEEGVKAHLQTVTKSVNNFCQQDIQEDQKQVSMLDACKDENQIISGKRNADPKVIKNRVGSCLLASTYYSMFSAFRRLMACEASERAGEQHASFINSDTFGKAFYDGVVNSSTGEKVKSLSSQAEALAKKIPPDIAGAIAKMQQAADVLTQEHVQRNIETTEKLAKQLYGNYNHCGGKPAGASPPAPGTLPYLGGTRVGPQRDPASETTTAPPSEASGFNWQSFLKRISGA